MSVGVAFEGENQIAGTIEAAVNRALGGFDGASVSIVSGGRRGAALNALIARVQARKTRDPFYLDGQSMSSVIAAFKDLIAASYSTRRRALVLAGELMLNAIGRNVDRQISASGQSFTPLTKGYAIRKQKKVGFTLPILRATGDLLDGLRVVIDGLT